MALVTSSVMDSEVLDTVREPLVVLDENMKVIYANRSYYRMFQATPGETVGRVFYEIGGGRWNIPSLRELLGHILPEHTTFEDFEVSHNHPGLGERTMLLNARELVRESEKEPMILLAIEDVTERKKAEAILENQRRSVEELLKKSMEDLSEAREALRKRQDEVDGYESTITKSLRGHMLVIEGASNVLRNLASIPEDESLKVNIEDVATLISSASEKASELIQSLSTLADSLVGKPRISDLEVSEVVARVLNDINDEIKETKTEVSFDRDLGTVRAAYEDIYQIFLNLIRNAVRHNDSSFPRVEIRYLGRDATGERRYLVRDNGSGVPEDYLEDIFMPFVRLKGTGTGTGLTTVERTLRRYGGRVSARNDGGAVFEFSIQDFQG